MADRLQMLCNTNVNLTKLYSVHVYANDKGK